MDFINVPEYYGYKSIAQAEREEWMAEGFADGRLEEKRQMAKAMLENGLSISMVSNISGLTVEEIKKL